MSSLELSEKDTEVINDLKSAHRALYSGRGPIPRTIREKALEVYLTLEKTHGRVLAIDLISKAIKVNNIRLNKWMTKKSKQVVLSAAKTLPKKEVKEISILVNGVSVKISGPLDSIAKVIERVIRV